MRHGKGIIFKNQKCVYRGCWSYGRKVGFCFFQINPHAEFEGMIRNEIREGIGRLTDRYNGTRYTGEYLEDQKHGFGRLETKNFLYVGAWFKGRKTGLGYQKNYGSKPDGTSWTVSSYFGYWKDNLRCGVGYETTSSREFKGEFKDDKYHGFGLIKQFKDNQITYAEFKEGKIVATSDKKKCKSLFRTDLDINLFLKQSKLRLTEFEVFIRDQKMKIDFNHKILKQRIDYDEVQFRMCFDRILVHHYRITAAYRKLKMQIFSYNQSVPLFQAMDFHIKIKDANQQQILEQIYYNCQGDLAEYLEFVRNPETGLFFVDNDPLHASITTKLNDYSYSKSSGPHYTTNFYQRFESLVHPWKLRSEEGYDMILNKDKDPVVSILLNTLSY